MTFLRQPDTVSRGDVPANLTEAAYYRYQRPEPPGEPDSARCPCCKRALTITFAGYVCGCDEGRPRNRVRARNYLA